MNADGSEKVGFDSNVLVAVICAELNDCVDKFVRAYEAGHLQFDLRVDESGHIKAEIDSTLSGGDYSEFVDAWWAAELEAGRLNFSSWETCSTTNKALRIAGMPAQDRRFLCWAKCHMFSAFVSDDIDFFDPSKKRDRASVKENVKYRSRGPIPKLIKRTCGMEIYEPTKFAEDYPPNPNAE